jgi:hypothetical protein
MRTLEEKHRIVEQVLRGNESVAIVCIELLESRRTVPSPFVSDSQICGAQRALVPLGEDRLHRPTHPPMPAVLTGDRMLAAAHA